MTIALKNSANLTPFRRFRTRLLVLAIAAMAASIAPGTADARTRAPGAYAYPGPYAYPGHYDGVWNVVFATTRGTCSSGLSVPFTVWGGRVSSAGGGRVNGRVSPAGMVAVSVSVGASRASGGGRLVGNYGAGAWRGIISGAPCSGTWQATRG
ncbi:hypothetical protein [Bradyrhizobium sp. ARR65]|uniref:hypothetical protein n=1 Tax=Bradyrhizobium sp. ARR65 TaxID=1040989 RepID=UPI000465175B|nr:hypothetical protein [Bradyrhizobium sp. ARR65]